MSATVWSELLEAARAAHERHPSVAGFCGFPDDLSPARIVPHAVPTSALMEKDPGLYTDRYARLRDGFVAAAPHAHWRETYKDTGIGRDFLNRFGCYALVGPNAPFSSAKMWAFVVYMPPRLYYPWHAHPAEELYLVIAGQADFMRHGEAVERLSAGGVSRHASDQPHAMVTREHPVMAYVIWRNGLDTPPRLTDGKAATRGASGRLPREHA